jgi:endonuclease/exonuclease/phosphatase (EEP) superfamily protein YafD
MFFCEEKGTSIMHQERGNNSKVIEETYASDHRPVLATFNIGK